MLADPVQAVISRLRFDPDVSALCLQNQVPGMPPRINGFFPESSDPTERWSMPDYAVLIVPAGGPAADIEVGRRFKRLDVRCYGPGRTFGQRRRLAEQLWRTVDPALCPPMGMGISASFHAGGCIVESLIPESEPIYDIEPGTEWPLVIAPYICTFMSLKAAA